MRIGFVKRTVMLEKEALLNTTHLGDVRDMTAVLPDALFTRKTRDASKTWARRDATLRCQNIHL